MDSVYKPAPPGAPCILDDVAWHAAVAGPQGRPVSAALPQASPASGVTDAGGRIGRNFSPERQQESIRPVWCLGGAHYGQGLQRGPVVVAGYSDGARDAAELA